MALSERRIKNTSNTNIKRAIYIVGNRTKHEKVERDKKSKKVEFVLHKMVEQ